MWDNVQPKTAGGEPGVLAVVSAAMGNSSSSLLPNIFLGNSALYGPNSATSEFLAGMRVDVLFVILFFFSRQGSVCFFYR